MTEQARTNRNTERLQELYPTFRTRIQNIIGDLESMGLRPRIQDAYRSPEDQLKAFNSGHSKLKFGFHNVTGPNKTKESLAVDLLDDNNPLNIPVSYLLKLAFVSEANGTQTGIRWGLPDKMAKAIDAAIAAKQFDAPVKVGWDPTHIETTGVTLVEAKAGKRPL